MVSEIYRAFGVGEYIQRGATVIKHDELSLPKEWDENEGDRLRINPVLLYIITWVEFSSIFSVWARDSHNIPIKHTILILGLTAGIKSGFYKADPV